MTAATYLNEMRRPDGGSLTIGAYFCWASDAGMPETNKRTRSRDIGMKHGKGADAGDPKHCRRRVADDAARAAGVGRGDNCCEIADADAALEDMPCHGRADQCRGDIVEE